jgi:hypothetical protein
MKLLGQVGVHLEVDPALINQRDHLLLGRTSQKQQRHIVFGQRRLAGERDRGHQKGSQHQSSSPSNPSDQLSLPTLTRIELEEASEVAFAEVQISARRDPGQGRETFFGSATSERRYRARRRFFNRACRIFRAFRLGLEIANVTLPTLRTFQLFTSGSLFWVSIFATPQRMYRLV